jgi:hypothetical protein
VLALLVNTQRALRTEAIYSSVFEHPNGDGPTIEAVKVPFPGLFDFGSGPEKATFFRMEVSQ